MPRICSRGDISIVSTYKREDALDEVWGDDGPAYVVEIASFSLLLFKHEMVNAVHLKNGRSISWFRSALGETNATI